MIAIQAIAQIAADKEAAGLSRVHMFEYKCILPPTRQLSILFLHLLILLECTQSAGNLFH